MSELIQKITGDKAEMLIDKALKEGIITEDEANWDSLPYAEAAYHLRHENTSSAREALADQLELAEALWMESDESRLNYEELYFLIGGSFGGAKALDKLERENCEPTSRPLEPHLEGLTEWSSSVEVEIDGNYLQIAAVFYTDDDDRKQANEDGWDSINWENRFSHYTITEP